MTTPYPRIPYGEGDFKRIRVNRWLYVDKTRFLRPLEDERYAFLIRPRRFGKTCWVSLLENYYDRTRADAFETVFAGTDIGADPTQDRNRYVILRFNFSAFDDALETLQERFEGYCHTQFRGALERNRDLFPEAARRRILAPPAIDGKLNELFQYAGDRGIPLFMLVDEYDNFANTVLAHRGAEAYESFTHGGGFYRNFFATLKAGTEQSGGGLERLFITGVSPITMDDVTSGFNIGSNISLKLKFNEMVGFTEAEVRGLLATYRDHGVFNQDVDAALDVMREWYDGYRFAEDARGDLYNTDMVLYYLKQSVPNEPMPRELIDTNVRIDYGKLRHLLVTGRRLNGNFDLLRRVIGGEPVDSRIQPSFPLEELDQRENFLSLMYYFGLLSIRGLTRGTPRLGIPNQTVSHLMYGYLRSAYREVGAFSVDLNEFANLTADMAWDGAWQPAFAFLSDAIAAQSSVRDCLGGERMIQGFLAAYLGVAPHFVCHTERELNKGYADVCLEPLVAQYPELREGYGYVIELEYLKRSEAASEARIAAAVAEATAQVRQYLADERLARQYPSVRFVGLAVVFHGWGLAFCDTVHAVP